MTAHKLQDQRKEQDLFAQAEQRIDIASADPSAAGYPNWTLRLQYELLRKETAEKLNKK